MSIWTSHPGPDITGTDGNDTEMIVDVATSPSWKPGEIRLAVYPRKRKANRDAQVILNRSAAQELAARLKEMAEE